MGDRTGCTNDRVEADRRKPGAGERHPGGDGGGRGETGERGSGRDARDRWLPTTEPFQGAAALDDLVGATGDLARTRRILGRYAAVRLARRAAEGMVGAVGLVYERRVAEEYVEAIAPADDEERRALGRIVERAGASADPELCEALLDAARLAAAGRADGGAFALYRTAFELAWRASRPDRAAAAAEAVARLARSRGAPERAVRWWCRNAKRARRLAELDEGGNDAPQRRQR